MIAWTRAASGCSPGGPACAHCDRGRVRFDGPASHRRRSTLDRRPSPEWAGPASRRPPRGQAAERAGRALGRPQGGDLRADDKGDAATQEAVARKVIAKGIRLPRRPVQLLGRHREPRALPKKPRPAPVDDLDGRDRRRRSDRAADEHADRAGRGAYVETLQAQAYRDARRRYGERRVHEGNGEPPASRARRVTARRSAGRRSTRRPSKGSRRHVLRRPCLARSATNPTSST